MSNLINKDGIGNWSVKDLPWNNLNVGQEITKQVWEKLYGCLCKLKDYESTGLTPQQVEEMRNDNEWRDVDYEIPVDDSPILLSFANFSIPLVGRYEKGEDGSGAFYVGDDEATCDSQDIFVNAWKPLPQPYRPE